MASAPEQHPRRHRAALQGLVIAVLLGACATEPVPLLPRELANLDTIISQLDSEAQSYIRARGRRTSRSGAYDGQLEKIQVFFNMAQRSVQNAAVLQDEAGTMAYVRTPRPPDTAAEAVRTVPDLAPRVVKLYSVGRSLDCPGPRCPLSPMTLGFFGV
jgi:hypothetical protein